MANHNCTSSVLGCEVMLKGFPVKMVAFVLAVIFVSGGTSEVHDSECYRNCRWRSGNARIIMHDMQKFAAPQYEPDVHGDREAYGYPGNNEPGFALLVIHVAATSKAKETGGLLGASVCRFLL